MDIQATRSYSKDHKPLFQTKITRPLKVVLAFLRKPNLKNRKDILLAIGLEKSKAENRGYLACTFTFLNTNNILEYNKKSKQYNKGENFESYLRFCLEQFGANHKLKKLYKEEYTLILKECSPSAHFILTG